MIRWRSALFVPADAYARVAKAAGFGADAVILDLEDGVALPAKPTARSAVAEQARMLSAQDVAVVVRINTGWRMALADLDAAVCPALGAIMVPKCEDPARLVAIGDMLGEIEGERGMEVGSIGLVALIESPVGLARAAAIAGMPRVLALALGSEDFSLALGVAPTPAALALPVRQIALAAAEHGMMALATPISIADFRDEAGWRAAVADARAVGATGALCIHPTQVTSANAAFVPSENDLAEARTVLAAWQTGDGERTGVVTSAGRMIDRPIVERARRTLQHAG